MEDQAKLMSFEWYLLEKSIMEEYSIQVREQFLEDVEAHKKVGQK
jgi:hypothetical protein